MSSLTFKHTILVNPSLPSPRLVDYTHTTLAELLDDLVVADGGADDQDAAIVALSDR